MRPEASWRHYLTEELSIKQGDIAYDDLLSALERAHRLGYATSTETSQKRAHFLAAPVLNLRNEPIAAISAVIDGDCLSAQDARGYSKFIVQAARQLSSRVI